jgi:hypothetical protein
VNVFGSNKLLANPYHYHETCSLLGLLVDPKYGGLSPKRPLVVNRQYGVVSQKIELLTLTREWSDPTCRNLPTVKILAVNTHCKYFLKIAEVTHFFCTRNRLYQRFVQPS